jgi:hypothetical protein
MQTLLALRSAFRAPLFSIRDMVLLCVAMPALTSLLISLALHP